MYTPAETTSLFEHLITNEHKNLHTRKNRQEHKRKVLNYLHGMKLKSKMLIGGYYCGSDKNKGHFEIEYEIDPTGSVQVMRAKRFTKSEALKYINSDKKNILKRIAQIPGVYAANYLKNNFYLRRNGKAKITPAAKRAVKAGILTNEFVTKMAKWKLNVIEGKC